MQDLNKLLNGDLSLEKELTNGNFIICSEFIKKLGKEILHRYKIIFNKVYQAERIEDN